MADTLIIPASEMNQSPILKPPSLPPSIALDKCTGWSFADQSLPRDEMIDAINGLVSIPAEFKAAYVAAVKLVPENFRFVRFDAHAQIVKGMLVEHSSVKGF